MLTITLKYKSITFDMLTHNPILDGLENKIFLTSSMSHSDGFHFYSFIIFFFSLKKKRE